MSSLHISERSLKDFKIDEVYVLKTRCPYCRRGPGLNCLSRKTALGDRRPLTFKGRWNGIPTYHVERVRLAAQRYSDKVEVKV